jgi:hypothetical protein
VKEVADRFAKVRQGLAFLPLASPVESTLGDTVKCLELTLRYAPNLLEHAAN